MAVIILCSSPQSLLKEIKTAIDEKHIETWSYDTDGDFTHSPPQWANTAWLRPSVGSDRLTFNILGPEGKTMSKTTYAVFHGRFIEMLLSHFDLKFSQAYATALLAPGDRIAPAT